GAGAAGGAPGGAGGRAPPGAAPGGAPAPSAPPRGGAPPAAVPAAAAAPRTLWSFLGISQANCAACRQRICASQMGMLLHNGMRRFGALTGGLLPQICPDTPTASDLASDLAAGGPQGVASQIKAAEAQAKAKIAALEYLATVDCSVWPEAEKAMIDSLRSDRTECVRYAAARALATGCCCTEKTAAALTNVIEGSTEDGGLLDRSERVKAAAVQAPRPR